MVIVMSSPFRHQLVMVTSSLFQSSAKTFSRTEKQSLSFS